MPTLFVNDIKPPYEYTRFHEGTMTNNPFNPHSQPLLQWSNKKIDLIRPLGLSLSNHTKDALGAHNTARFLELKALQDGWDFGRGKALQAASLRSMESFLAQYHSFPERCSLFLSEKGNLELVWRSEENATTSLEFYPDHIEYYVETLDKEGAVSLNDIPTLVHILAPTA